MVQATANRLRKEEQSGNPGKVVVRYAVGLKQKDESLEEVDRRKAVMKDEMQLMKPPPVLV